MGLGVIPCGMPCLLVNGAQSHRGIIWKLAPLNGDANSGAVEGVLRAYAATQFDANADGSRSLRLLWHSKCSPNNASKHNKFGPPMVANGKVYMPTSEDRADVYGLQAGR